jgi:ABC-2 type transport system permease protein
MRPFLSLLNITFRNYYGLAVMKEKYIRRKKELWQPVLALIGIGVGGFILLSFYYLIAGGIYAGGKMLGQPALVLELSLVTVSLVIFIFGISALLGTLYFTQDNLLLAALPLRPFQVLAAKFSLVIFNQYLVLAFFIVPPLYIFARGEGTGLLFALAAVLVFLLFPVVPLAPAAVVAVVLMSRAGSRRLKDLFTFLTYTILIVLGIGIQFFMQTLPRGGELESLQELIRTHGPLLKIVEQGFPPVLWATKALSLTGTVEGWVYLALFLALSAVQVQRYSRLCSAVQRV